MTDCSQTAGMDCTTAAILGLLLLASVFLIPALLHILLRNKVHGDGVDWGYWG